MSARHTARRCAALALFIAAGSVLTPARAAESTAPTASPTTALPDIVGTKAADGSLSLKHVAMDRDAVIKMADPRYGVLGSLDVTRALLAKDHGIHLPDLHPESRLRSQGQGGGDTVGASMAVASYGPFPIAGRTGDLNADGRDDVIVYDGGDADEYATVFAVSGVDGAELWRRPPEQFRDVISIPVSDVTGDGAVDLFMYELSDVAEMEWDSSCTQEGLRETCTSGFKQTYQWNFGVASGADGRDLWRASRDGLFEQTTTRTTMSTPTASSTSYEADYRYVNGFVALNPAGDFNGDGAGDVLYNLQDATYSQVDNRSRELVVFAEDEEMSTFRASSRAVVASGATGETLVVKEATDVPATSWAYPVSQLVGDATPDLLWDTFEQHDRGQRCEGIELMFMDYGAECTALAGGYRFSISAIDGATTAEAWTIDQGDNGGFAYPVGDVTGDGAEDLTLYHESGGSIDVISGSNGMLLWTLQAWFMGIDDNVVVSLDAQPNDAGEPVVVNVTRRQAATGAVLTQTSFEVDAEVPGPAVGYYTFGLIDGRVLASAWQAQDIEDPDRIERSHIVYEDGTAGLLVDRRSDEAREVFPFVDLDGDGGTDVIDARIFLEYDEDHEHLHWTSDYRAMRRLLDDEKLWDVPAEGSFQSGGNQDGVAGEEVILARYADDESLEISSLDGPTGARRWALTL